MTHLLSPGEAYSLLCAFIWAVSVVLFTGAGTSTSPVALNLFKNLVGMVLFTATRLLTGISWTPANITAYDWAQVVVSGVIGIGIADTIFFAALNRLKAGGTAIVESFYSPFVVLFAALTLHEPLSLGIVVAVGLMVTAVLVGTGQEANSTDPENKQETPSARHRRRNGIAYGLLATVLMAAGIVIVKPVLDRTSAWWIATVRLGAGTAWLLIQGSLPSNRADVLRVLRPSRRWKVLLPAGVIGCYLATITWVLGMQKTFASKASVLNQTSALMVVLLAAIFLGEKLTWRKIVGVALAITGAIVVASV